MGFNSAFKGLKLLWPLNINPLKTKRVCFIQGLTAYRAVNTLNLGYTKPVCQGSVRQKSLFVGEIVQNT